MKKKYIVTMMFLLGLSLFGHFKHITTLSATNSLSNCAIRFHVLANSDSAMDQQLKMKVKENVVNYIYEETKDFTSLEQTKNFLINNDKYIREIALSTINTAGFDYCVNSKYGTSSFPDKTYGDIVFPKGSYPSYIITIGKGKGHNWWCVLYPPLCFVDSSTGIVPDSSKELLQDNLSKNEYSTVVQFRFKYLKFLNKYIS